MITRISKIHGHRIFGDFSWPANLPEFGRFNLIYGWNASGKTTLSNLLRFLEKKEPILEGTVDFQIDGRPEFLSYQHTHTASADRVLD